MIQQGRLIKVKHGGDEIHIPTHNIIAMGKSKLKAWVIIQGQKIEFDPVYFKEIFESWSMPMGKEISPFTNEAAPEAKISDGFVKVVTPVPGTQIEVKKPGAIIVDPDATIADPPKHT